MKLIPMVIVTSSNEDSDIRETFILGANSYAVKPVCFKNLMESMTNIGFYGLLVNQTIHY